MTVRKLGSSMGRLMTGASLIFSSAFAAAQEIPTDQPPVQPSPTASPSNQAGTATAEEVVVTANKREENPQEVPSSVSVINDVELDNFHATQLTDYAPYIPGFQVNSGGSVGQTTISLRGLAPISAGTTVSTYIDETPIGSSGIFQAAYLFELDLLPYDIRRVEVLRGPQSTLYGANSIGGLIKYVTQDPSLTTQEFHVGGGISGVENGDEPGWDAHIGGTMPLLNGTLGLRLSYGLNENPGFIDNVVNGEKGINDSTQQSALISVLWQPNENVRLKFTALGQRVESDNNSTVALDFGTLRPVFGDLTNQVFVNEPFTKNIGLVSATLNLNVGWADFTSATAYANTRTETQLDATAEVGQLPLLLGYNSPGLSGENLHFNLDKFTQEVRLTSKQNLRFEWQFGAFYTHERGTNDQSAFITQLNGTPFPGFPTLFNVSLPSIYQEGALFANATFKFTDQFSLGGGVRFSRNDQEFTQISSGLLINKENKTSHSAENVFDYMVTPQFKLGKDQLLYARIATGYQPGGPNAILPGLPQTVGSSRVTNYEAGLKSEFFDHRLLFDLSGYRIDWTNIQIFKLVNNNAGLVNGGEATSNGVELTTGFEPIKDLRFGLNGAYTDATLDNNVASLEGRAGDRLPEVPVFSASATVDYYFTLPFGGRHVVQKQQQVSDYSKDESKGTKMGGTNEVAGSQRVGTWNGHVGAGLRWVGSQFSEVESSSTALRTPSYSALDLNADVSNEHWTIRVFAKNVTDERAYPTLSYITDLNGNIIHATGIPIQPRTVGLELDYKF